MTIKHHCNARRLRIHTANTNGFIEVNRDFTRLTQKSCFAIFQPTWLPFHARPTMLALSFLKKMVFFSFKLLGQRGHFILSYLPTQHLILVSKQQINHFLKICLNVGTYGSSAPYGY